MSQNIKVLLIGAPLVGKTKLTLKLLDEPAIYHYLPTSGVDRHCYFANDSHLIYLYDTGGAEQIQHLVRQYYKTPDLFVLTFAFEKKSSLYYLAQEIEHIKKITPQATMLLLGLKNPTLTPNIDNVSQEEIETLMSQNNIENYFECNSDNPKYLNFLNEKFIQVFNKKQDKFLTIRNQNMFDPHWKTSYPLLKRIEYLLLNSLLKGNINNFFEFKRYENKRAVIQIIKRHGDDLNSWHSAFSILNDLKVFDEKHQNSMQTALDYLEDKLEVEYRRTPCIYPHTSPAFT